MKDRIIKLVETVLASIGKFLDDIKNNPLKYGKIVALFMLLLILVVAMVKAMATAISFLNNHRFEVILIIVGIAVIYSFIKQHLGNKHNEPPPTPTIDPNEALMYQNAINGYPPMRTIVFLVTRDCSSYIGGIIPRVLADIEVMTEKFIPRNGVTYYQFRLTKEDIRALYTDNELLFI